MRTLPSWPLQKCADSNPAWSLARHHSPGAAPLTHGPLFEALLPHRSSLRLAVVACGLLWMCLQCRKGLTCLFYGPGGAGCREAASLEDGAGRCGDLDARGQGMSTTRIALQMWTASGTDI